MTEARTTRSQFMPFTAAALGLLMLIGCAGQGHDLRDTTIPMTAQGAGTVGVGVHDERAIVRRLDRKPSFVGYAFVNDEAPQDVNTASGRPLADEWNAVIVRSLRVRGFDTLTAAIGMLDTPESAARKLRGLNTNRTVFVLMRDWKFITTASTKLYYDLTLRVLDRTGRIVAETTSAGEEDLGDGGSSDRAALMRHAQDLMPGVFQRRFEAMLNDPKVAAALR